MIAELRRIARTLSEVEDQAPQADAVLRAAYARGRHVPVIGLTGPPGAGKSTLIDHLAVRWAEAPEPLAILAVDPSSPFSGGAVLGDRLRMPRAAGHPNVFLRSVSCRGQIGGLSRSLFDLIAALGQLGFGRILVETVGSGQTDLEIAGIADCVVVLSVPGLGDEIQTSKAGILEIADVHAVNKSDTPHADAVAARLESHLNLIYPGQAGVNASAAQAENARGSVVRQRHGPFQPGEPCWRPPVHRVVARDGRGVAELAASCDAFLAWRLLGLGLDALRHARIRAHLQQTTLAQLSTQLLQSPLAQQLDTLVLRLGRGELTPSEAARELLPYPTPPATG